MKTVYKTDDGKEFDLERDALYHEQSLRKNDEINGTQELMFQLIERASFNGFDGEKTVKFLRKNRSLWDGVTMGNDDYYTLRDIEDDSWHADTLKILAREGCAEELKKKVKQSLSPDEISIEPLSSSRSADSEGKKVIRAWWD